MADTLIALAGDAEFVARQQEHSRREKLQRAFWTMLEKLEFGANRAKQAADLIEDKAAPHLASIVDRVSERLHAIQEKGEPNAPFKLSFSFAKDPCDEFKKILEGVAPPERLGPAMAVEGWQEYLLFRYLSDVVGKYDGILINIDRRSGFRDTTIKLSIYRTAADERMRRLGVRFSTCRLRHFLLAEELKARGIRQYLERDRSTITDSDESEAHRFYDDVYGELIARRLVTLNVLREYDPALVKALYKACDKEKKAPRDQLPESRAQIVAYNLAGIGGAVLSAVQAFTTKKWRAGNPSPM